MSTTLAARHSGQELPARMPVAGLMVLELLGFIAILTETLPAGLLPQIGRVLSVGDALTGQLVTAYALGSVVAAIPGAMPTRRWPRRRVLLTAVGGFLLFHTITAVATSVTLTLAARFMTGAAAGIAGGGLGGGILLVLFGPWSFAPAVPVLALVIAHRARSHAFPSGGDR